MIGAKVAQSLARRKAQHRTHWLKSIMPMLGARCRPLFGVLANRMIMCLKRTTWIDSGFLVLLEQTCTREWGERNKNQALLGFRSRVEVKPRNSFQQHTKAIAVDNTRALEHTQEIVLDFVMIKPQQVPMIPHGANLAANQDPWNFTSKQGLEHPKHGFETMNAS